MTDDLEARLKKLLPVVEAAVKANDWKEVEGFRKALRELREIGSPSAVALLSLMLESKSRSVKVRVLESLWKIDNPSAMKLLTQTLETSEDEGLRRMAARGLIRARGVDALDLVAEVHRQDRVQWDIYMVKHMVERAGKDPRVFDTLVEVLQSDKMDAWSCAIWGLGALGDKRAVPIIEELMKSRTLLKTGSWHTHYSAADTLIKLGAPITKERRQTLFPRHGELAPEEGVIVYRGENLPEQALAVVRAGETFLLRAVWSKESVHETCLECKECWEKSEHFDPPTFDSKTQEQTNALELHFVVQASDKAEAINKTQRAAQAYLNQRYCLRPMQAPQIEQLTHREVSEVISLLKENKYYFVK